MKLHIQEGIKQVDSGMFITDYVGDVVNLFVNKPKPYRVVYNQVDDVYGVGDAYKYIHGNIQDVLIANGYGDAEFYHDADYGKHHQVKDFTFVPYLTSDSSWEVGGFVGERSEPTFIKTGTILTNSDLQTFLPDLYNKLRQNRLLLDTDPNAIANVLRNYAKELQQLRKQERSYLTQFKNAGFDIRTDYKGIPNFKYYLQLLSSDEYSMRNFQGEITVHLYLTHIFNFPEDREERMDFLTHLGNVGNGLKYALQDNLSVQCHKYEIIKKLLDRNNLPYKMAFEYV